MSGVPDGLLYPVTAGAVLFAFSRGWKRVDKWQESKKKVNQQDHILLHTLADALLDQQDVNGKLIPGTISKVDTIMTILDERLPAK